MKNRSRSNASLKTPVGLNAFCFRALITAACLIAVGAGIGLLAGGHSRAATPRQEGKSFADGLWQDVDESSIPIRMSDQSQRDEVPKSYRTVHLNMDTLRQQLANAPLEFSEDARNNPLVLTMPLPDGKFGRFELVESPMMEPELAAKFPEIKNYRGHGIDDLTASMRCDLTPQGFHAFILSAEGTFLVAPYAKDDTANYISYYLRNDPRESAFACAVQDNRVRPLRAPVATPQVDNGATLHTYRLAVAATAEYTANNGGTKLSAFSAINTTIMGVNVIYAAELSIQLTLIANENDIIYLDKDHDPYTSGEINCANDDGTPKNCLLTENQSNLDATIGSANYDVGQVVDTGNTGVASRGVSCDNSRKGRGTTGGGNSVVLTAHEIGHQFGASHTFNDNVSGACGSLLGNSTRAADSAYEPGSGSTIMSYGGTCGAADLQPLRDSYFHIRSLEQIVAYTTGNGGGSTCDVETPTNRGGIVVTNYSPEITVPAQTPFKLSFQSVDLSNNPRPTTVTWEEFDLGDASPPEGDNGNRPIFRSYLPSLTQSRTFPRMDYILASNTNTPPRTYVCGGTPAAPVICLTGESRTETGRTMTFVGTARDNAGAVHSASVQVKVIGGGGPFAISTPNSTTTTWTQGTKQQIVWTMGGTTSAPISCENVKISLSTDAGLTFRIVLAESTPNDGSEFVFIPTDPNLIGTRTRIKVESIIDGNFNSFFDISDNDVRLMPLGVSNTNDSGAGSLRQAILDANTDLDLTTIRFFIDGAGVQTINLQSELPVISAPVVLDGWSQGGVGYSGPPLIELNGAAAAPNGTSSNGLTIIAGSSTVRGLAINRFNVSGIDLRGKGNNRIEGCYIGTNAAGTAVAGNVNGVFINNTPDNRLGSATTLGQFQRNIISGNNVGVLISGTAASGNSLSYNLIGTNTVGARLSNTADGIRIIDAPNNLIGGTRFLTGGPIVVGTGNIVSGNGSDGIEITGTTAVGNTIQANFIGLALDGTSALGNFISGIHIEGAPNNIIGGANAATGNVISGNDNSGGIRLIGSASGTVIQGNYLGTNIAGDAAVRNNSSDIYIESANNLIGGTVAGARNVISGAGAGVSLAFGGATGNVIQGNYIGTDATGTVALNSNGEGISVRGASNNTIGGTTAVARNIISGNGAGIHVVGGTTNLLIQGNYIGTNPAGTAVVGNKFQGVLIEVSSNVTVGGTSAGARNVISGNGSNGSYNGITILSASNNTILGNYIGTNATGDAALGNNGGGIVVAGAVPSTGNVIGGTTAGERNVISASTGDGILITGNGNIVVGNYLGTDVTGTLNFGNGATGVEIAAGDNNIVGSTNAGAGNLIAFSGAVSPLYGDGVRVSGGFTDGVLHGIGNRIRGNAILSNVRLGIDLLGGTENSGVTMNDACDADTGANKLQNAPVLTAASGDVGSTTISGTLEGAAGTPFAVDFYASPSCNASGSGEGKTYLGSTNVITGASCSGAINVTLPVSLSTELTITATATDPAGNTSEFSPCLQATAAGGGAVLGFNVNSYDAPEGYNAVTIKVDRAGPSNGTVTVDYAVQDSTASQSSDYSTAAGTLTFASGELSKTFTVLINDDSFVEGSEFIDLSLSNPTGGARLAANANGVAKIRLVDNDIVSPPTANTIDDSQNFVYQHYHDFLAREPDAGGLAFWTGQITQCGNDQACLRAKRIDVSNAFFYELEYQQTGSYVFRLYREAFGNNQPAPNPDGSDPAEAKKLPSYTAFSRDRARVVGGADLASGQLAVANAFAQRTEFLAKYPLSQDGPAFVDAVLATIKNDLGADLMSERPALITLFNSGGRGAVLYRLADDSVTTNPINNRSFIDAEYNRAFVATQYFGYLRRDSDIGGFLFWLGQVNGAPLRDVARQHAMVCSFVTATEYQQRFSSVITHGNGECR